MQDTATTEAFLEEACKLYSIRKKNSSNIRYSDRCYAKI